MLLAGAVLQNRYEVVKPIGKGGMGAVYLAKDTRLGSQVALKETLFQDEALRRAFEREARLLAGLSHSALPRVMDHFTEDEGQFLVMEYIAGDDLETLFKSRQEPFAVDDILEWGDQLLDALEYLHAQDPPVVHRDIKPQNLKLAARNRIVLLDFGLAKGQAADMTQTSGKSIFGYTAAYAPLEQMRGVGTDPRSDLYSLGATLYHLLTRTAPADAVTRANAVVGAQPDPFAPANELNPQVSPAVAQVLQKATALHADQRIATAGEFRAMLKAAGNGEAAAVAETVTHLAALPTVEPTRNFATTPVSAPLSEAATEILPPKAESQPQFDYSTQLMSAEVKPIPRWRLAAGGVVAASALGATLWAVAGNQTATPQPLANQAAPTANANAAPPVSAPSPVVAPATKVESNAPKPLAQPPKPAQPEAAIPAPAAQTANKSASRNPAAAASATPAETDGMDEETRQELKEARQKMEDARRQVSEAQRESAAARRQREIIRRRALINIKRNKMRPPNATPLDVPQP
jgi:serine/threonine protein kinase